MNFKFSKLFVLCIVLVTIFTLSFGIVNAQPKHTQSRDKDHHEPFDRDRIRQQDRDCELSIDCLCDQLRKRDRDFGEDCICDKLCDQTRLRLRVNQEELIEEILLCKKLELKLEEAVEEDDDEAVEEIVPQLEKVKAKLQERVKDLKEELEDLKLRFKNALENKFNNGQLNQFRNRIKFIEDEIEIIEDILE